MRNRRDLPALLKPRCTPGQFAALVLSILFSFAAPGGAHAQAQELALDAESVCAREAPWNRTDGLDPRAEEVRKASDWATPSLHSGHPAGKLSGLWAFKLEGLEGDKNFAHTGRISFHQEGEGYECRGRCGYKRAKSDAKWLTAGERWGHINYGRRTADNPEDMPRGTITVSDDGAIDMPPPQYYWFPAIKAHFDDKNENSFTGTWSIDLGSRKESGKAIFTRARPTVSKIIYKSTVEHETDTTGKGCVALDYGGTWWGRGNNMRGNRPGFNVEIYADNLFWSTVGFTKIWIDPATRLEINSTSPEKILALDENGKATNKVLGVRLKLNIWPGTVWGPKTLYIDGIPLVFDYYVKPVYEFDVDPAKFQLVHGHFPELPEIGQTTQLGFRLVNLPDHAQSKTSLDFTLTDSKSFEPAPGVSVKDERCALVSEGKVRCQFDKIDIGEVKEIELLAPMPEGGLNWVVEWDQGRDKEKVFRLGSIAASPAPLVLHTFSISDQIEELRPQTKDFRYPYPKSGAVDQVRNVAIFGKNLPQKFTDETRIESLNPSISYTPRFGAVYSDRTDKAWTDIATLTKSTPEKLKEDFQLFLLEARVKGAVLPGEQSLKLNGKLASWDLRFGGLQATIEFVREGATRLDPTRDQSDDKTPPDEVIETAYAPERIYIRVTTSAPLPIDGLPLVLDLQQSQRDIGQYNLGNTIEGSYGKRWLTATKTGPTTFRSPPIRLLDKGREMLAPPPTTSDGELSIKVSTNGRGADQLAVEIEESFVAKKFALAILPASGRLPISRSPGKNRSPRAPFQDSDFLFKSYLVKAAKCKDLDIHDWDALSSQERKTYTNRLWMTFFVDKKRSTELKVGHYAVMLMLRDIFIELLNDQVSANGAILSNSLGAKGFLDTMRLELYNNDLAVNRIKVTAPDGSRVEFGSTALIENTKFLAKRFNTTEKKISEWRLRAATEALGMLSSDASDAAAFARKVGDCDVDDLLKLTGKGFGFVAHRLRPRLMKLQETSQRNARRLYWVQDLDARYWLNDFAKIAKKIAKQKAANELDNLQLSIAFAVISLPVMIAGTPEIAFAAMAADFALMGNEAGREWKKVIESKVEVDFSRQSAVAIGFSRNDAAIKSATSWLSAYHKTLFLAGVGVLVPVEVLRLRDAINVVRAKSVYVKGRSAIRNLPKGGIRALAPAEQRNAQMFAFRAKMREQSLGKEALDSTELRAITAIENDFRVLRTELLTRPKGSQLFGAGNPVTLPPSYAPNVGQIRFVPIEYAKTAVEKTAKSINFDEPLKLVRVADDVPKNVSKGSRALDAPPNIAAPSKTPANPNPSRGPPQDGTPTVFVDDANLENKLNRTFGDEQDRVLALQNSILTIKPGQASNPIYLQLGSARGGGSTSAVFTRTKLPWEEFETFTKVAFRSEHKLADSYGKNFFQTLNSDAIVVPRVPLRVDIPPTATGSQKYFSHVSLEENFGFPANNYFRHNKITSDHRNAFKTAYSDINGAGHVVLDSKLDQFGFVGSGKKIKLGWWDFGGVIKVKGANPELAKEIQNVVNGPWEPVRRALDDLGLKGGKTMKPTPLEESLARKRLIQNKYSDAFDPEDLKAVGVTHIRDFQYNPAAGWQLERHGDVELSTHFTSK